MLFFSVHCNASTMHGKPINSALLKGGTSFAHGRMHWTLQSIDIEFQCALISVFNAIWGVLQCTVESAVTFNAFPQKNVKLRCIVFEWKYAHWRCPSMHWSPWTMHSMHCWIRCNVQFIFLKICQITVHCFWMKICALAMPISALISVNNAFYALLNPL